MNTLAVTIVIGVAGSPGFASADIAANVPSSALLGVGGTFQAIPVAVAYKDGTFTGPAVNAYWGDVQVQVVVQGGLIASLNTLRYPSDRRESLRISQQALPLLRNEAVRAQSARVNVITGATLTSQAFMRSLDAALTQALGLPGPSAPITPANPGTRNTPGGNTIGI